VQGTIPHGVSTCMNGDGRFPPPASVHLPRMGLRGSDWYAVERAVRRYLVSHGIPTYVYLLTPSVASLFRLT